MEQWNDGISGALAFLLVDN